MVRRIFVEKKADPLKRKLIDDIKQLLGIDCPLMRRILRYDVDGISEELMERAAFTVFSEPPVDKCFYELQLKRDEQAVVVELLDGQFDQRADSASQCIQLLSGGIRPAVKCATVYVFSNISSIQLQQIQQFLINPVETKLGQEGRYKTLESTSRSYSFHDEEVKNFTKLNEKQLEEFYGEFGFACTKADLKFIQDYFKLQEKRNPTVTELKVIDTYWSDHCRHTTFMTQIGTVKIDSNIPHIEASLNKYKESFVKLYAGRKDKYPCFMDIVTIAVKELKKQGLLGDLDESEEVNACSVVVDVDTDGKTEQWLIMFKNETHNHPTEIEPFGGAATCLGGAIRDPLSGRSYVYQAMRVSGGGNPLEKFQSTIKGKLPQRVIAKTAANGYASYGNQVGVATGQVCEVYNDRYKAKRMECGFVIAGAPKENVVRKTPKAGDKVLIVGAPTGRDGCGGATGSSKAHTKKSVEQSGAEVQKGNPPEERKIQRLFRNKEAAQLIIKCNDFGAGGASVAIGELAPGVDIHLEKINTKYEGLTATELALSESQERMAVIIENGNEELFVKLAAQENLSAVAVATVTDKNRLRMFYRNNPVVDLARNFLDSSGVRQKINAEICDNYNGFFTQNDETVKECLATQEYAQAIGHELKKLNVCSKKGLGEMFDGTIGAATVLMPFGGQTQLTPAVVMAAKVPADCTSTVTCCSNAVYPDLMIHSPYVGTANAITSAVAKLVSCGVKPASIKLTLQEYFKKLGNDPLRWGEPLSAMLAAYQAQTGLCIGAIGGKDSMSGSFEQIDVPPTVVAFAFGVNTDKNIIHNVFPDNGFVTHIKIPRDKHGVPDYEKTRELFEKISSLIETKTVIASNIVEDGGRICALVKSMLGNNVGAAVNELSEEDFFPSYGDFIVVSKQELESLKPFAVLNNSSKLTINEQEIAIEEFAKAFGATLEPVFPATAPASGEAVNIETKTVYTSKPNEKFAKPRVLIPVFPGTNCEYDTARAFTAAGAEVKTFIVRNRTGLEIEASASELKKQIDNSQIIAFPGGFSGGDEPDGSGKFIAVAFQNPKLREALETLLFKRDGLALGICNGFQALIKLGLLPYGQFSGQKEDSPTLTANNIGRHVSTICNIRIASKKSPWLSLVDAEEIYSVPVSHGEGKFVCNEVHLKRLIENEQIATQYVDFNGNATMKSPFNPNGSVCAVEGLLSPDGRIFGKMGHSERWQSGLYQNIKGNFEMPIFQSGVKYFE